MVFMFSRDADHDALMLINDKKNDMLDGQNVTALETDQRSTALTGRKGLVAASI
jgi:hypothetical protein